MQNPPLPHLRISNPFALRFGQVMTGFGIGCGVGIGVGRPLNLGAIPGVGQIAGEATKSFGTIGRQVHGLVKKLGFKNLEVGIGCGVGLGHGFGVGITLKPGAVESIKLLIEQNFSGLMVRVRSVVREDATDLGDEAVNTGLGSYYAKQRFGSAISQTGRTGNHMQSTPMTNSKVQDLRDTYTEDQMDKLRVENTILQTLLRHQEQIEDLKKQNTNLQHLLEEELKSHSKVESAYFGKGVRRNARGVKLSDTCWKCRRCVHKRA